MALKITVTKDGKPIKFASGGMEVTALTVEQFVFVTNGENGANFSVHSNGLTMDAILGKLAMANTQVNQDFISKNYGSIISRPEENVGN